jgi:hypothetical protein
VADDRDGVGDSGHPEVRARRDAMVAGRDATYVARDAYITYVLPPEQPGTAEPTRSGTLQTYLGALAGSYEWLELRGIPEAETLRIELEKVYIALRTEPETDYDLHHLANLHSIEVQEAAGGIALDLIDPVRLAELDAENVRRTYRPRRDEARLAGVTDVTDIAAAVRLHHRMVILGGPGSGKTTMGRWLALQFARQMLQQAHHEVAPERAEPSRSETARLHVLAGTTISFSTVHFVPPDQAATTTAIRIDALPERGRLALRGAPVTGGQVIGVRQIGLLTYTPAGNECGSRYACVRFTAGGRTTSQVAGAVVLDVGTHVRVPASQVDPDRPGEAGSEELVDLGPARVPIFLRLAHFAHELAQRDLKGEPTLSLENYLGRDPDSCKQTDGCTAESRNALLRAALDDGQAVVILDGLDELPEVNRRTVSPQIQKFIKAFTMPNAADGADDAEEPWRVGGNQVLVTSRYVGYKLMPIRSGCAHFGIQPMRRRAVEHFVRSWSAAVNAKLDPQVQGQLSPDKLIAEIYDDSRAAIRELATNPLLITILAIVYWADGKLPDQRAGLYDRVVENLLLIWLNRPECQAQFLLREEVLAALQPLAADMQGDSSGLISLGRIQKLIEEPLALARGTNPADPAFRQVLDALLMAVQKHVGLLAEQSVGNYAFFHRTVQEFLAARYLLADRQRAAGSIVGHLDDPLWREPLLLALGLAMIDPEWNEPPQARARLLEDVLAADDQDSPIPQAAMLVMSALPDLKDVPQRVLARLVGQLLRSYALSQGQSQAEGLRESIRDAFARLHRGPQAGPAAEVIAAAVSQPAADHDCAGAAAEILLRVGWFTTEIVDALLRETHRDQARLGWPVHWALLAALGQPADDPSRAGATPDLDMSRLVTTHLPMRELLESSPDLTAVVQDDVGWLWLMVALYGGLGHVRAREHLQAYQHARLQELWDASDAAAGPPPPVPPIEFTPGDIVYDLADQELSSAIASHLRAGEPASALTATFRRVWEQGADPEGSAEALIGLAALGEDGISLIRTALADRNRQPAAQAALGRFQWLSALLQEPVLRSAETAARTIPAQAPQEHQVDLLRVLMKARAACGVGPFMVSDTLPSYRYAAATSPDLRARLDAEYWAYAFSGLSGGDDTLDEALTSVSEADPGRLIRGWSQISRARNLMARPRLPWPQAGLSPRCETPVEQYLAMLDQVVESPPDYGYHAGFLLGRCRPLLDDYPALIWETLAICCSRGGEFLRGYLVGATGDRAVHSGSPSLATRLVAAWDRHSPGRGDSESLRNTLGKFLQWRAVDGSVLVEEDVPRAARSLLAPAGEINDPYLRFRALWRTMEYTRAIPPGLDLNGVVEEIADPHEKSRAIDWLLMSVPDQKLGLRMGEDFLDRLSELTTRIADPENRALAQCRLALIVPGQLDDMLDAAVESVGQIPDPHRRAETIGEVRSALGRLPSVAQALDVAAEALSEPWLRDKAHGRDSRLMVAYRDQYQAGPLAWRLPPEASTIGADSHRRRYPTGQLAWGTLYLSAVAAEAEALAATPTMGSEAGWELLLGPEPQAGVDALIESAADGGLRMSAVEASTVNRVVQLGHVAALRPLWPYLDSPDAGAMAMITRWAADDADMERWKALVQMEAGYLTPDSIAPVIELLASPADRLRLRAALALYGPRPYSNNRNRRWSVTRVGAAAIEVLAEHATRADYPPAVLSLLGWVQCDIHHDDAEALGRWLSTAATDEGTAAGWILDHIESIDDALVDPLLTALPLASPGLQRTLLSGLARVASSTTVLDGARDALCEAIAAVPPTVRRDVRVLPQGAATFLAAAATAAAGPDEDTRLQVARSIIEESRLWLDDECLSDSATCLSRLKAIGHRHYIQLDSAGYSTEVDEAAAPLAEDEDALRLLLAWAESPSRAEGPWRHADLMSALEAVARISPSAFTALADPDAWEPILIEWVATGNNWVGSLAAVRLLGMLRRVTDRIAGALQAAMKDNPYVQRAAYVAVAEFRSMKGDVIPELLDLLADPSAGVVASTARLLASLAQGEGAHDRRRILRGLQNAVTSSPKAARVYLMRKDEGDADTIEFVDRLDRVLYQAIFEVNGS